MPTHDMRKYLMEAIGSEVKVAGWCVFGNHQTKFRKP